jgi:pilus assembly protein CpaC
MKPLTRHPKNWRVLVVVSLFFSVATWLAFAENAAPAAAAGNSNVKFLQVSRGAASEMEALTVATGRSLLVDMTEPVERVSVTNPDVAEAVPITPQQILINGKTNGSTSLVIWDKSGRRMVYELNVQLDVSSLSARLKEVFPTEQITVTPAKDSIVLSGFVSSEFVATKAVEMANLFTKGVVNMLRIPPSAIKEEPQIMLQVRFAEVSRNASQDLGANIMSTGLFNMPFSTSTQQFSPPQAGANLPENLTTSVIGSSGAPVVTQQTRGTATTGRLGGYTPRPPGHPSAVSIFGLADALNLFAFRPDLNLGATIRALESKGLLQILAEPNLITRNGKEASFLAGGEFPYAVISGTGGPGGFVGVTIQFKEFGIRLTFTPTVTPTGSVRLKVKPEVSDLDFANAVVISGFTLPSIRTRRADTEVELKDGQSFAIAGLIDNRVIETYSKIPLLADVPVLGYLFKSRALRKTNNELLVLITPKVVKPMDATEVPALPERDKSFLREKNLEGKMGHQEQKKP